ncbi:MAG: S1 RNA-binding domain-containing protein [Clostridiales bacterium]|nr:S1 RNA-binding domain-containing protein [Clostridiales bacterium]
MPLTLGSIVEGRITGISKFGAFVELPDGRVGLVHISEVADTFVRDISDYLSEQDTVKVKIIDMPGAGKIGLSIKQASAKPPPTYRESSYPSSDNFEDKLSRFMKESNEKLTTLKRHQDNRKGR